MTASGKFPDNKCIDLLLALSVIVDFRAEMALNGIGSVLWGKSHKFTNKQWKSPIFFPMVTWIHRNERKSHKFLNEFDKIIYTNFHLYYMSNFPFEWVHEKRNESFIIFLPRIVKITTFLIISKCIWSGGVLWNLRNCIFMLNRKPWKRNELLYHR